MSSQNSEKESGDESTKDPAPESSNEKLTLESLSANSDSSSDGKFGILLGLIKVDGINEKDIIDTTFSLLIDGTFDLELNFVINSSENINHLVQVIDQCPKRVQAEIWSVFIAMVKKSKRNVLACAQAQLIEKVLSRLADADAVVTEILVELLSILATFSITVKEMKTLLSLLKTKQGTWSQDALKLLEVLKLMLVRHGPDEFFSFPGKKGSAIAIPPISKWPYQNGWTINCWFQLDPITGSHIEREKPYLYCFCTSKGVGYSGHFLGSTFVITAIKMKGKGYQHCVQFEFQPRKWYMLSIVHVYNRWSKSEIRCYVDGQLVSQGEMSWFVNTNDQFDRCFIGSSPEQELDSMFSGQISSIYGFSDALSPQQIQAIFALGAGYKGQFKFHKESQLRLSNSQSKVLYEGRLQSAIVFLYNPVACDGSLSLDQTPRANPSIFVHSSHAMMSGEVTPVVTQSINASLHSLGGIQALFPLFSQLDCEQPGPKGKDEGKNISTVLMSLIYDLLNHSQFNQQQFQHSRGFLVISQYLEKSSPRHLNADVLNIFIALSKLLMSSSSTATLLRQLYNYILFNPPLWIRASIDVQIRLYYYLSVEFVTSAKIFTKLRRISAVLHILHTLKYYYWIANPRDRSGIIPKTPENMERPDIGSLVTIRSSMLVFMKHLILREDQGGGIHDDEMQAILNYLTTVNEDDNLQDVLRNTMNLMHDSPASMVPAFDRKNGISTVFKLLSSPNERIRINTLKLLGFFLRRSTHKRKHDTMGPHNLFSLVGERLLLYCPFLTMATYNALFEILTERVTKDSDSHDKPDSSIKLENPLMLKVIADLIRQSKPTPELLEVKTSFLTDLTRLCESSKENRRTVLQMSVWQDWLFGLAPLAWKSEAEEATADMVMGLLRTLLYHAIKCEYGGWRVWVDTLAVLHSRISYEDFRLRMSQVYREYADLRNDAHDENQPLNSVSRASDRVRNHVTTQTTTAGHRAVKEVLDTMVAAAVGEEESHGSNGELESGSGDGEDEEAVSEIQDEINEEVKASGERAEEGRENSSDRGGEQRKNSDSVEEQRNDTDSGGDQIRHSDPEDEQRKNPDPEEEERKNSNPEEEEKKNSNPEEEEKKNSDPEEEKRSNSDPEEEKRKNSDPEEEERKNSDSGEEQKRSSDPVEEQRRNSDAGEEQRKNSNPGESPRKNSDAGEEPRKNSDVGEAQRKNSDVGEAQRKNSNPVEAQRKNSDPVEAQRKNSDPVQAQRRNSAVDPQRRNSVTPAASKVFSPGPQAPPFRIPEFRWSLLHQRLLAEVLECVEEDVIAWKSDGTKTILENVNSPENHVYVINLIHLVSQLSDTLVTSCGGLLPLLAVATSPGDEIDMLEVGQGLKMEVAVRFMLRIMLVADVVVFASSQNFAELENDKNMANGAILRQCLRLVATCAVLNCFECRYRPLVVSRNDGQNNEHDVMYREALPPNSIQGLLKGMLLTPSNTPYTDRYQPPPKDQEMLLQDLDINRLRATVYRAVEDNKQAQFLSLAIVYFVSVLMVSKYRDILEPPTPLSTPANSQVKILTASGSLQTLSGVLKFNSNSDLASQSGVAAAEEEAAAPVETCDGAKEAAPPAGEEATESSEREEEEELQEPASVKENGFHAEEKTSIAAIAGTTQPGAASPEERPNQLSLPAMPGQLPTSSNHEGSLTQRLERALGSAAPLLREIFIDFAAFLSKTLLGSHGQELVSGGLVTLRQSSSVVELVMLLCSQEWQNSLQKNAGLAFIELVNEGRLLSHATRDHIVRVSNEAEYILNRMRAEDVQKHAEFGQLAAQRVNERREEEKMCDHLVTSARQRDASIAKRLQLKLLNIISKEHGFWGSADQAKEEFCRLDTWEDDSRRRRRLVPNPYGSNHADATLRAAIEHGASEEEVAMARKATLSSVRGGGLLEEGSHGVTDEELCGDNTSTGGSAGVSPGDTQSVGSGSGGSGNAVNNVGAAEMELAGPVSLSTRCVLLAPGVSVNGTLAITESELFFEMDNEDERNRSFDDAVLQYVEQIHGKWNFAEIRAIFSRRFLHKNVAVEIFMANRSAVMFALPDQAAVKAVVNCLPRVGIGVKYGLPQTRKSSLASPRQIFKHSNMTGKWQRREISNFDYLMYLNTVAGRSFNDLNQYPVFPWVLANYDATELDLSQPSNYRDLSKPIGALNPSRKAFFDERFATWDDDSQPAFHFGTHYSTAAFVLNYLVRVEPFTSIFLSLQGSKFDHADRTFHSVGQSWANCQRDTSDVKELIPEFFYLPEMLRNDNGYNLGVTDSQLHVGDVLLPAWAATPEDFVRINRMALESELVSCQLHQWIDLVFGYKQRGPEAVRATNVFYHLTYEGSLDWSKVTDPVLKQALEDQIRNFGQTPSQLLTEPHPPRNSALHVSPMMFAAVQEDVCMVMKFLSNSPVVAVAANTHPAVPSPAVVTIAANHSYAVNRWNNAAAASIQQAPNLGNNAGTNSDAQVRLPLSMDSHLAMSLQSSRRHLGDNFDERLPVTSAQFATTPDNRTLFACGYWDKSFRVYALETCRIVQVVYGHFGVVTCLARSECNFNQDCYVVTGSQDCSVVLWLWSNKHQAILGGLDGTDCDTPTPRATLTGHQEAVSCVCVSAELGIIVSGSTDGVCLLHTTHGDLLRTLPRPEVPAKDLVPRLATYNREGLLVVQFGPAVLVTYTLNGRLMRTADGEEEVSAVVLSRCGQYIVMATQAGVVNVRRSHDLHLLYSFPACDAPIRALGLTHDQRFLLAGLASGCLVVFNIDFNKWHHEFQERYS